MARASISNSANDSITDNLIGTDPTGTTTGPGNQIGVEIDGVSGTTIGGTTTAAANVIGFNTSAGVSISGTASSNFVEGNFIGTDSLGNKLANLVGVFVGGDSNIIGGTAAGAGNVIGANTSAGVSILGASNIVEGDYIGTDAANDKLDNTVGVFVGSGSNTIGGTSAGAENTIGFNSSAGISISGSTATSNVVAGNLIGTNSGGANLANGVGVFIGSGSNVVGGITPAFANEIGFNTMAGVSISGSSASDNTVEGNFIGTDLALDARGNSIGVVISNGASGNVIGGAPIINFAITTNGTISSLGTNANYIVGNASAGVSISGAASSSNTVEGNLISRNGLNGIDLEGDLTGTTELAVIEYNFIGTNATGTSTYDSNNHPLGNGLSGILLEETSTNTTFGSKRGCHRDRQRDIRQWPQRHHRTTAIGKSTLSQR